ncbi:hypothetical protein Tco_0841885 [Tanacetum coccineum]|uniref:Retrotransposon gag domain-containing protein n=1 Tax=Tanacetum coccineum TaxID=301880 RepID=A0ABQ5B136_9ASTR
MAPKKAPALTEANINHLIQERIDEAIAAKRERVRNENNLEVPPLAPTPTLTTDLATNPAPGLAACLTTGTASRECTFVGFLKCNPTSFHGNEGAVGLIRWIEKSESVFDIIASMGCAIANSKYWTEMKAMMTEEFCPPKEIQRMDHELWNLKKVEAYIRGLSDNIQGEVTSSSPTTLSRTIRMAHKLMEQKCKSKMDREAEAKKQKWESFQPKESLPRPMPEMKQPEGRECYGSCLRDQRCRQSSRTKCCHRFFRQRHIRLNLTQQEKMRHGNEMDNGIPSKEIHERHRECAITAEEAPD